MIARLHHITQNHSGLSHTEQARRACAGGVRWVQVRVKDTPYDEWLRVCAEVKYICDSYGAVCIVNDNVDIAKAIDAHGVHLGKSDMTIEEARNILGHNKIIGGSSNTIEDIKYLAQTSVDYIGLGPYKFTYTKTNLNPVLGAAGISALIQQMNLLNISLPVIAIGGITLSDVDNVSSTGVHGIAISSAINLASDSGEAASAFILKIQTHATITHS